MSAPRPALACRLAAALLASAAAVSVQAAPAGDPLAGTKPLPGSGAGLLPVNVDAAGGHVFVTLPPPGSDGVSARMLYVASLRTGIGSSDTGLDHGQNSDTQLLAFRRLGGRIVAEYENPRFRASGGTPAEQAAARDSFAITTAWVGDIARTLADGSMVVDLGGFLTRDAMRITDALGAGGAGSYKLDAGATIVDAAATRVFPDNIELEARQTFVSDKPGSVTTAIAPDARSISLTVHHSLIRLPAPGYVPIRFDPRFGGFATQVVDYGTPLGREVVYALAQRFRLEKTDPAAARSTVRKPIVFYIDRAAPEPIRGALADGVGWWSKAFDAAGYVDAFQVKILPEGVDPLDVRYNVVNWVNRATRGWSYGQVIADPRTGEIVKGSVLLGSLRTRQDILIYEALVGADKVGGGGANDPVQVALARIRQLGAHEVGHALGFEHNFAASTQDRASVMDYPAPRIGLRDGAPDLSDAYGVGVGRWDMATVDRLYGTPGSDREAKAAAIRAEGLRFVSDGDARSSGAAHPWASMWDDGPDPVAELERMMTVRRAALDRFGMGALRPGEPVENLRRKFVPVWLLHRYQVEAAAKLIGGVDFAYAVAGGGAERSAPVVPARQRAALESLLATLATPALTVPVTLIPLLSAGRSGPNDRQFDIEVMASAGGPVFDPLAAAAIGATVTLDTLLDPDRLQRLAVQRLADPQALAVEDVTAALTALVDRASDPVAQRVATVVLLDLARLARAPETAPGVAVTADDAMTTAAARLSRRKDGWSRSMARMLGDPVRLAAAVAELPKRAPKVPPGMPIGASDSAGETDWMERP